MSERDERGSSGPSSSAAGTADTTPDEPAAPLLRVVNPDATPEEIAAIVAVLSALGGGTAPAERQKRSEWANPARQMRTSLPSSWRASALPR